MMPFTSLAWNILGLSFALSGYIAWKCSSASDTPDDVVQIPTWLLRTALLSWEMAAPFTLLVATVIRYAIWPTVLRSKESTENLKCTRNRLMHNANVFMALVETALLGGLPVHGSHVAVGPLVGCMYVLFSWSMTLQWNPSQGPQFIYFFMDTTLPGYAPSVALVALLLVMMVFYAFFCWASALLRYLNGGVVTHVLFAAAICCSVMRFRD